MSPSPSQCSPQNATFGPLRDILNTNKLDVATCDLYEFAKRTTLPDSQNSPFIAAPTESGSSSPLSQEIDDESTNNNPGPISYKSNSPTHSQLELGKCRMAVYVFPYDKCHKAICANCADSKISYFCALCCVNTKWVSTATPIQSFIIRQRNVSRCARMIEQMTFIKWQVQNQRYLGKASQDDEESPTLEFEKEVVEETLLPCHQKFIDCLKLINSQWHRIHWDVMMCMHEYLRLCQCKALLDRWRKTQEKEWSYTRYQTYDRSASTANYKHLKRVELGKVAFAMELLHRNAGYHSFCLEPEANIMQTK